MRLRRELIERIAARMAATLDDEKMVSGLSRNGIADLVGRALTEDFQVEDRLNDEVREIIREHMSEMDRQNIEHHEMFKKIKSKLVRDRKLIL